jgi:spore germination protein YaaH
MVPTLASAVTTDLVFSAWVPYWKKTLAVPETIIHLNQIKTISPFSYEVKTDGTLIEPMRLNKDPWPNLLTSARNQKVKIIPSILWTDRSAIQTNLFSVKKRQAHINNIMAVVKANNFAGIDIDYENKFAETKTYFSKFIMELSAKLHAQKKLLVCTIEPRTPNESRLNIIPDNLRVANDYAILGKYCDEIRLMAYDQGVIDLRLNETKGKNGYYAPVADPDWVTKVIAMAKKEIPAKKLVLGVANYGYEYEITDKGSNHVYKKLRALNYATFSSLATSTSSTVSRSLAGELSFTYQKNGKTRYATLSDSQAIADKVALARKTGLAGVILFKVDGESDPNLWAVLK